MANKLEELRGLLERKRNSLAAVEATPEGETRHSLAMAHNRVRDDLIQTSLDALPGLLDEITRLNAENAELRAALLDTQERSRARGALVDEMREGLESIKLLVGDAFSGEVGAAQALDAVSDVANALLAQPPVAHD